MSEVRKFHGRPNGRIHRGDGELQPIIFDTRGVYETDNENEIKILKTRHYVTEFTPEEYEEAAVEEAQEKAQVKVAAGPAKTATKGGSAKTDAEKEAKRVALEKQEADRLATEAASKKAAEEAKEGALHTITDEDLKANPKLAEKFKVGDKVDLKNVA